MNDSQPAPSQLLTIGIDEVGRGCVAGPVSACAFAFFAGAHAITGLADSKKLTPLKRELLVPKLEAAGMFGHGSASAQEIDEIGIVPANFLAMRRALEQLLESSGLPPSAFHVVVDGNELPPFQDFRFGNFECLIKADDLVPAVSAASVLAKVKRDAWMTARAVEFPGYGFESHMGYGSARHFKAIDEFGPCELHRMTFGTLRNFATPSRSAPRP